MNFPAVLVLVRKVQLDMRAVAPAERSTVDPGDGVETNVLSIVVNAPLEKMLLPCAREHEESVGPAGTLRVLMVGSMEGAMDASSGKVQDASTHILRCCRGDCSLQS